jgi:hypothetical protein
VNGEETFMTPFVFTPGVRKDVGTSLAVAIERDNGYFCPTRTSGRMTFRLQPNWPTRHDMLNNDAVTLHHNALHNSL